MTAQAGTGTGTAMKRRSILAVAGAAVAAAVAKQLAEPVGAANASLQYPSSGTITATNTATATTVLTGAFDGDMLQLKNTGTTPLAGALTAQTAGVFAVQAHVTSASTASGSIAIDARQFAPNGDSAIRAIVEAANTSNSSAAIDAQNVGSGGTIRAVRGTVGTGAGPFSIAIEGQNDASSVQGIGVSGRYNGTGTGGIGVSGLCDTTGGIGVQGSSVKGIGVLGTISSGSTPGTIAVKATNSSTGNAGVGVQATVGAVGGNNTIGVRGVSGAGGTGGIGVHGQCDTATGIGVKGTSATGTGVRGESSGSGATDGNGVYGFVHHVGQTQVTAGVFGDSDASYGVIGRTTAASYSGCTGIANLPNTAAFAGAGTGGAICAFFTVVGGQKNAAVKHTDGSYRLLHCVESPEPWFEDFGEGKLVGGRAEVTLDPDFAAVVDASRYMVFLTERGETNGLYVGAQTAGGFAVQERGKGAASAAFYWRVVARRKDITTGRLARFEMPKIRMPKPEELPKHA